jgi:hypothetical protein
VCREHQHSNDRNQNERGKGEPGAAPRKAGLQPRIATASTMLKAAATSTSEARNGEPTAGAATPQETMSMLDLPCCLEAA